MVTYTHFAGQRITLFVAFLTYDALNAQYSKLDSLFQVHQQAKGDSAQINTLQDYAKQLSAYDIHAALAMAHQAEIYDWKMMPGLKTCWCNIDLNHSTF